ncbi:MAG: 3-deoxy-D-manno-octulosonic acid transferase [Planctomycetota bacterium]|jgi:3-deoxy-D-manno-octulosonic-acid transferase|nr:3-deoxy-D-manno-octulosonic acid transferase [Planctomycetota bacterium]
MANFLDAVYGLTIGPHYLWHRHVTGRYGPRCGEKLGRVPDRFRSAVTRVVGRDRDDPHYEPPCLWVHAVSVGEVVAAKGLVKLFMADNPLWEVKISTTTPTGRRIAEEAFGAENVFYYPLDFSWMVKRALDRVRPNLVVLVELEIWPNFLAETERREIPVVVANARITERSVKRLARVPRVAASMAKAVREWYPQTVEYAERLRAIGVPDDRVEILGSVKYDAVPSEIGPETEWRALFGCHLCPDRPLLVAGSTHPGEEKAVLEAVNAASERGAAKARVVLVPRHPERLPEAMETAKRFGPAVLRSSLGSDPSAVPEIVVGDVMGELAKIYAAADLVFVGGTIAKHGGQNIMEPCGLAKPTVAGPHLWNFAEPAAVLADADGIRIVEKAEDLADAFYALLSDPEGARAMAARGREALLAKKGATRRIVDRLDELAREAVRKHRKPRWGDLFS